MEMQNSIGALFKDFLTVASFSFLHRIIYYQIQMHLKEALFCCSHNANVIQFYADIACLCTIVLQYKEGSGKVREVDRREVKGSSHSGHFLMVLKTQLYSAMVVFQKKILKP